MTKLHNILNRISVKVALIIIVLIVAMFISLDIIVVDRGTKTFRNVYETIRIEGSLPSEDTPFIFPTNPNQQFSQPPTATIQITPREHFRNQFQASLLLLGLAALGGAIAIGFLIAQIIARPLSKLSTGMKKLRQNHYQERLNENDSEEFNILIREFNDLAAELQRVEELRKNLISDTSHELRTPLASLAAQLEGLEDGVLTMDIERIKLLKEQVARLSALTDGLQDYAHIRSQAAKIKKHSIRVRPMLNSIVTQYKSELDAQQIQVKLDVADSFEISADPELFKRLFTNLIDNTLRYAQAKNITISADQSHIVFTDDGVGIPPVHQRDIFERFFRLEKSRNRAMGGMGLGLSIVREIVEAHGWKIYAKTPESHRGVEFVIEL